jgi:hypothetical protein
VTKTFYDVIKETQPEAINEDYIAGVEGCPMWYPQLQGFKMKLCSDFPTGERQFKKCMWCWNQLAIPRETKKRAWWRK